MKQLNVHSICRWFSLLTVVLSCSCSQAMGQGSVDHARHKRLFAIENPSVSISMRNVSGAGVTITSLNFQLNPEPVWVRRLFGDKSVYYGRSTDTRDPVSSEPLSAEEIKERTQALRRVFALPEYAISPPCSISMYGVVYINPNEFTPFSAERIPYIGQSSLTSESGEGWKCFYRAIYENWRSDAQLTAPNYRAVIWYCPAETQSQCDAVTKQFQQEGTTLGLINQRFDLSFHYKKYSWDTSFEAVIRKPGTFSSSAPAQPLVGVCTAIPYSSSDPRTLTANRAMLMEWIRHYTHLGMKVAVYDSFGKNKDYIFDSTDGYKIANDLTDKDGIIANNLLYFNYTIHSMVAPLTSSYVYDNTEKSPTFDTPAFFDYRVRYNKQGNDKVLTLSHCRFEMKSRYGIDRVIVVDPDEFLYCPNTKPSYFRQAKHINKVLQQLDLLRFDQFGLKQYFVSNRTSSVRQCVYEYAQRQQSIFECFASTVHGKKGHSHKSLHLQHACPFTGYHESCATTLPRAHDCICSTTISWDSSWKDNCVFIHLSTKDGDYDPNTWDAHLRATGSSKVSELRHMRKNSF